MAKKIKQGGARPNAGRKAGTKLIEDKALLKKTRGISLNDVEFETLNKLGGVKWLREQLQYIYLKHSDKYFKIPACNYYFVMQLNGVFEVINKLQFDDSNENNKFDLTTIESINNDEGKIILNLKDDKIVL